MIRRDYILRMLEELARAIARLNALKQDQRWSEASEELDEEFKKLVGGDVRTIARLSETDLQARLMQEGPTHALREKTLILTTLLKEAGDIAIGENKLEEGCETYLKSLHLLLDVLAREDPLEFPESIPKVEMLVALLQTAPLPPRTNALLMRHYESVGEFAKAEDALFAMLDADLNNESILEFGRSFYHRLQAKTDSALEAGNLPRSEVEDGLKTLESRYGSALHPSSAETK